MTIGALDSIKTSISCSSRENNSETQKTIETIKKIEKKAEAIKEYLTGKLPISCCENYLTVSLYIRTEHPLYEIKLSKYPTYLINDDYFKVELPISEIENFLNELSRCNESKPISLLQEKTEYTQKIKLHNGTFILKYSPNTKTDEDTQSDEPIDYTFTTTYEFYKNMTIYKKDENGYLPIDKHLDLLLDEEKKHQKTIREEDEIKRLLIKNKLDVKFATLADKIKSETESKINNYPAQRQSSLKKILDQLNKNNYLTFFKEFYKDVWALPDPLQKEALKLIRKVEKIVDFKAYNIPTLQENKNVFLLKAGWDTIILGLAKIEMKFKHKTYGRYLDRKIQQYNKKLENLITNEGTKESREEIFFPTLENDFYQRMTDIKNKIKKFKCKYNKYSYFEYDIKPYMEMDRKINRLEKELQSVKLNKNTIINGLEDKYKQYSSYLKNTNERERIVDSETRKLNKKLELAKSRAADIETKLASKGTLLRNLLGKMEQEDQDYIKTIYSATPLPDFKKTAPDQPEIVNIGHAGNIICYPTKHKPVIIVTDPLLGDAHHTYPAETRVPIEAPYADCVFISHNHMDHTHPESIKLFYEKNKNVIFIVPRGCTKEFMKYDIPEENIITAGQCGMQIPLSDTVKMTITPAVHWSGSSRAGFNGSGVISCVIDSTEGKGKIFYAGDSAAHSEEDYKQIFSILNNKDDGETITLILPSGPNFPRKYMRSTHMSTGDAINYLFYRFNLKIDEVIVFPTSSRRRQEKNDNINDIKKFIKNIRSFDDTISSLSTTSSKDPYEILKQELKNKNSVLTHHKQIHFGKDRFNETDYVINKMLILLYHGFSTIDLATLAEKNKTNAFIYESTATLLKNIKALLEKNKYEDKDECDYHLLAATFLLNQIESPAIGGQVKSSKEIILEENKKSLPHTLEQAFYEFKGRQSILDKESFFDKFLKKKKETSSTYYSYTDKKLYDGVN